MDTKGATPEVQPQQTPAQPATQTKQNAKNAQAEKTYSLDILTTIKQNQNQHGLRHGDYQRYRNYCSRRVRRLRRSLKFTHGKHKFQKKNVEVETVTDSRYLLLVLMEAERSWSYAMQLKDNTSEPRVRFHMHRKLAKAAKQAKQLEIICNAKADKKTTLEAEAYSAWMGGNILLEKEEWEEALSHFIKARTIFDQLGKVGDSDYQDICRQKVEEIEPSIRYCNYNLGKKGDDSNKLLEMRMEMKGPGIEFLQSKLDAVIQDTLKKQTDTLKEVVFKNKKIPIKNEKIRVAILSAQETTFELEKTEGPEKKMEVYDKLFVKYNDALRIAKDELTAMAAKKNTKTQDQEENINALKNYITYLKLQKTVDRNLVMADSLDRKLFGIVEPESDGSSEGYKKKTAPDDLVRVYEIIIQNLTELAEMVGDDVVQSKEIASKILAYKAIRCFYMAVSYSYASRSQEALALFDRASEHMKVAIEQYAALKTVSPDSIQKFEQMESRIRGHKAEAHAKGFLETVTAKLSADKPTVQENKIVGRSLINSLNEFDPSFATNKQLVNFPPEFESVRCKAILFDLAFEHCEFPNLEARKKPQAQTQGSGIWSWFGRKQ